MQGGLALKELRDLNATRGAQVMDVGGHTIAHIAFHLPPSQSARERGGRDEGREKENQLHSLFALPPPIKWAT